jgi:hypothetical protein
MTSPSNETSSYSYPSFYGQVIPKIEPNKTYVLNASSSYITDAPNKYFTNLGVLTYGKMLKEIGSYQISYEMIGVEPLNVVCDRTITINRHLTESTSLTFLTKSITELSALEEAKSSSQSSFWSMLGTWVAVFISIIVAIFTFFNQKKDSNELLERLDSVASHIETATDREIIEQRRVILEKNTAIISGFLNELEENIKMAQTIKTVQLGKHTLKRFSHFCLDEVLRSNIIFVAENKLFHLREIFVTVNNVLDESTKPQPKSRLDEIDDIIADYLKNENLRTMEEIQTKVKEYQKSLRQHLNSKP